MNNTFSIRGTFREANQLMKNRRWMMIKQYALIAFVFQLALAFLLGKGAMLATLIGLFITTKWALAYVNKGSFSFDDITAGVTGKQFVYFLGAVLLMVVSVIGGTLLLIIPGIVFYVRLVFVKFITTEKEMSPRAALKESKRITKGHRWKLFFLLCAVILLNIVGFLCLVVGIFVTAPLSMLALAVAYKKLSHREAVIA